MERDIEDIPDVTWKQTVAYYTFLPMLAVLFATYLLTYALLLVGRIEMLAAVVVQWLALEGACLWVVAFGDGIIPAETYRKRRANKWYHLRKQDYWRVRQSNND